MGTFISTRGRYAIRVLIDLADNYGKARVPLKDIAARQDISLKYLESIMPVLVKGGIVSGSQGKGGGRKGVYIFELKLGEPVDRAFAQIRARGYADPYVASGKPIWLVGLSFDRETRKLVDCAAEPFA